MMGGSWTEEALKRRKILTNEERQALLEIPRDAESLARLFTLSRSDRHRVAERLSDASRLGFAVQLALLRRHPGTVLANLDQLPEPLVMWLATQLGIPAGAFAAYAQTMTDYARRWATDRGTSDSATAGSAINLL
jgi:TnpA family transposase